MFSKYIYPYLQAVAEIYDNGLDNWDSKGFAIRRIYGGANNALYKIDTKTESLACKLCVDDGRERAAREFGALKTIQAAGYDIAPEPLLLDESQSIVPFPVVIYRWADGDILKTPVTQQQLETFLDSFHQLHRIQPSTYPPFQLDAWFHWFDFNEYLIEIAGLFDQYTPWLKAKMPGGYKLQDRLQFIINECATIIASTDVDPSKECIPLRLVRIDPNIANAIVGPQGQIRWVDWEYSGWGDPALDIAELRWHAALQPLGEQALKWLRANYKPSFVDPGFWERVRIWDHILATRWPLLILRALWSNHNGPDRKRLSTVEFTSESLFQRLRSYIRRAEKLLSSAKI